MEAAYPEIGRRFVTPSSWTGWATIGAGILTFPRVNEATKWGPLWKTDHDGWLHFAGDHTSYAVYGLHRGGAQFG